jgi:ADP-ribosylglycohydrolase
VLTHGHDAAIEGAAGGALAVYLALQGKEPSEIHQEIVQTCAGRSADFDVCLAKVPAAISRPPGEVLIDGELGESWVAEEAIASALFCVWRHPGDFAAGVLEAVNTDGDSDSIACIAGGILGARLGLAAIPQKWRDGVEDAVALHALGERLLAARD